MVFTVKLVRAYLFYTVTQLVVDIHMCISESIRFRHHVINIVIAESFRTEVSVGYAGTSAGTVIFIKEHIAHRRCYLPRLFGKFLVGVVCAVSQTVRFFEFSAFFIINVRSFLIQFTLYAGSFFD